MPATQDAQIPDRDGVEITFAAPLSDDDSFENTGKEIIVLRLSDAVTVTIDIPFTVDSAAGTGLAVTDRVVSLLTGTHMIGPFPKKTYDDEDGLVNFSYGGDSANAEVAILRLP